MLIYIVNINEDMDTKIVLDFTRTHFNKIDLKSNGVYKSENDKFILFHFENSFEYTFIPKVDAKEILGCLSEINKFVFKLNELGYVNGLSLFATYEENSYGYNKLKEILVGKDDNFTNNLTLTKRHDDFVIIVNHIDDKKNMCRVVIDGPVPEEGFVKLQQIFDKIFTQEIDLI